MTVGVNNEVAMHQQPMEGVVGYSDGAVVEDGTCYLSAIDCTCGRPLNSNRAKTDLPKNKHQTLLVFLT